MGKLELALLIGLVVAIFLSSFGAFAGDCAVVREQVLRLHVLANSDEEEDQALKLQVRDAVLVGTAGLFEKATAKQELIDTAELYLCEIETLAREEVTNNGYDYPVRAEVVNMYFDTRTYEDITLPAGYYDAVRLTIGAGEGQNWWCVMFPPMCIPAASESGGELSEQIEHLNEQPLYVPKFAIVELLEKLMD